MISYNANTYIKATYRYEYIVCICKSIIVIHVTMHQSNLKINFPCLTSIKQLFRSENNSQLTSQHDPLKHIRYTVLWSKMANKGDLGQ